LRRVLTDDVERDHWSRAAKARAAAFSWERTAQLTESVLREAAAEPRARACARRVARIPRTLARCVSPFAPLS
jgi:hypothetical protein